MHYRNINCNRESELTDLELHQIELKRKNRLMLISFIIGIGVGILISTFISDKSAPLSFNQAAKLIAKVELATK